MSRDDDDTLAVLSSLFSGQREDLDFLGAVTAPGQDGEPDDPAPDEVRQGPAHA